MAHKRKMEITVVDENERALFSSFSNAANNLSQFYAQSVNQQKLAFEAGQKYSIVKFHEWVAKRLQEGKLVKVSDVLSYLQAKMNDWVPDIGQPEEGVGGSEQNNESRGIQDEQTEASSAPVTQCQDSYPEMQMDAASDDN